MTETVVLEDDGQEFDWPVTFTLNVDHKQGQRSEITVNSTDEIAALAAIQNIGQDNYLTQIAGMLMGGYEDDDDWADDGDDD